MRDGEKRRVWWLPLLIVLFTAGACSPFRSGTAPDDMSVEEHRRQAEDHAAKAREHENRYDPDAVVESDAGPPGSSDRWGPDYDYRDPGDYYWGVRVYNPTARHRRLAEEQDALAREHLRAASALERFEGAQCRSFPPETRPLCPLIGQLVSVRDVPNGTRVRFADGVDVNAAVAHIRCHLAFARSRARVGMDSCPLYLEGVRAVRVGPGSEVDFLVDASGELGELRERMRAHLAPEP